MRLLCTIILLFSLAANTLTVDEARHLLARTGFGGTPQEIDALKRFSRVQAVHYVIDRPAEIATPVPDWASTSYSPSIPFREIRNLSIEERQKKQKEIRTMYRQQGQSLKGWWLRQMVMTENPFHERMVLFWHNHFTSSMRKVNNPYFIYQQHQTIRNGALGNFGDLVKKICRDPAMIIYLDTHNSVKSHPNENFARELMELFTLGEGNYAEEDIRELARCFTGWKVNYQNGTFRFVERQHDARRKKVLGEWGDFAGVEVIDVLLRQDAAAVYIVEKLWREFISPYPVKKEVQRLASGFRNSDYKIKPLLHALFMSRHFWDKRNRGQLIKSPVELLVGTVRVFKLQVPNSEMLMRLSAQLGQDLFNPPNVKGWPGGPDWISAATLLQRQKFLENCSLLMSDSKFAKTFFRKRRGRYANEEDAVAFEPSFPGIWQRFRGKLDTPQNRQLMEKIILTLPALSVKPEQESIHEMVRRLMLDPAYQLK